MSDTLVPVAAVPVSTSLICVVDVGVVRAPIRNAELIDARERAFVARDVVLDGTVALDVTAARLIEDFAERAAFVVAARDAVVVAARDTAARDDDADVRDAVLRVVVLVPRPATARVVVRARVSAALRPDTLRAFTARFAVVVSPRPDTTRDAFVRELLVRDDDCPESDTTFSVGATREIVARVDVPDEADTAAIAGANVCKTVKTQNARIYLNIKFPFFLIRRLAKK